MKCVLFDLDGTLWDACDTMVAPWNDTLREEFPDLQRPITGDDLRSVMGLTAEGIGLKLFPQADPARSCAAVKAATRRETPILAQKGGDLYAGVPELLKELSSRYRVGIVSNCGVGYTEAFLQAHHMKPYVHGLLCLGMTGRPKGENIDTLRRIFAADAAVYVGDTNGDETAARAAGVPFIHAAYGFGTAESPDAVAESPAAVAAAVERLLEGRT